MSCDTALKHDPSMGTFSASLVRSHDSSGGLCGASQVGRLFGGAFEASVELEAPAGELHTSLPFEYRASLHPASMAQVNTHIILLLRNHVRERLSAVVEEYSRCILVR